LLTSISALRSAASSRSSASTWSSAGSAASMRASQPPMACGRHVEWGAACCSQHGGLQRCAGHRVSVLRPASSCRRKLPGSCAARAGKRRLAYTDAKAVRRWWRATQARTCCGTTRCFSCTLPCFTTALSSALCVTTDRQQQPACG
jgi:hypothetical protein